MSLKNYDELTDLHIDVLREIGNIGCGNSATALATMLNRKVDILVPKISIVGFDAATKFLGGPEMMVIGMMLTLSDDVDGMLLFLLEKEFAHITINDLLGCDFKSFEDLDEMGLSMIQEIGNIMGASYVNAIATLTGLTINISTPDICLDMVGSIMSVPAIYFSNIGDKIIFIENRFELGNVSTKNNLLLIPDIDSLGKILQSLGIEI